MPDSFKKIVLVLALLFGIGALALTASFGWDLLLRGRGTPFQASNLAVAVTTVIGLGWAAMALMCARALADVYREELRGCPGRWHLSLSELLLATLVTAMLMLAAKSLCTPEALPYGIGAAFLVGFFFLADLLISARKGRSAAVLKNIAAVGTALKVLGWPALAIALFKTFDFDFVNRMFFAYGKSPPERGEASFLNLLRFGLLCLPTGFLLGAISNQFSAVPTTTDGEPEETLRKLLNVKSGLHRAVNKEEK